MHIAILGVVSANGVDSWLEDEGEDEFGVRVKTKRLRTPKSDFQPTQPTHGTGTHHDTRC